MKILYLICIIFLISCFAANDVYATTKKSHNSHAADLRYIRKAYAAMQKSFNKLDVNIIYKYTTDDFQDVEESFPRNRDSYARYLYSTFYKVYSAKGQIKITESIHKVYYRQDIIIVDILCGVNASSSDNTHNAVASAYQRDYWMHTDKGLKIYRSEGMGGTMNSQ